MEYLKSQGKNIFSIGAAARASTLINYVGLNGLIDNVLDTFQELRENNIYD